MHVHRPPEFHLGKLWRRFGDLKKGLLPRQQLGARMIERLQEGQHRELGGSAAQEEALKGTLLMTRGDAEFV